MKEWIGWRARIGVVVPYQDYLTDVLFNKVAPLGVTFHHVRMKILEDTPEGIMKMNEELEAALERLPPLQDLDFVLYSCTGGSFIGGPEWNQKLIERIEGKTGLPATTTTTAVIAALNELGVKKVSVASPYSDEVNSKLRGTLEYHGFEVVNIGGMRKDHEVGGNIPIEPIKIYRFAKSIDRPEAQCLFISCTGLRALEIESMLERDLSKPVIGANSAQLWYVFKLLGIKDPIEGFCSLLEKPR